MILQPNLLVLNIMLFLMKDLPLVNQKTLKKLNKASQLSLITYSMEQLGNTLINLWTQKVPSVNVL